MQYFLHIVPFFILIKMSCFFYYDLYKGMWRYTSLPDLYNVIKAATAASLIMLAVLLLGQRFVGMSRSVFVLDWLYTILFVGGVRISIRIIYGARWVRLPGSLNRKSSNVVKRVVLLGAGEAGEKLIRDVRSRPTADMVIVALFDDDPDKQGRLLHGLPVVGGLGDLPLWTQGSKAMVQQALIAMPSLSGEKFRRVVALCEEAGLEYRTIPSLSEIANGKVSLKLLRDVDYKDLLAREPARLENERIAGCLQGKRVLVTGAGGSIGSELCRQIALFNPASLLLVDSAESSLYAIGLELVHERGVDCAVQLLGNLQDKEWLEQILDIHKPQVIFHAAAYKHVPMMEAHPWEAVHNNVLATVHLLDMAVRKLVEQVLVVSTDKAVRPTNVMGATKRLTEKLMQAYCGRGVRLMAVRFGNVLGSSGSVVPLFRRQIERGGPVTVTHPEVMRYFMTVEEACQLILQAGAMGGGGEVFVLRMGQPVKIADMAADLIRLSGKEPGVDVEIKFIGLRPGEKLYEELITADENVVPTGHEQIMVLTGEGANMETLQPILLQLEEAASRLDGEAIRELLRQAAPEYTPAVIS